MNTTNLLVGNYNIVEHNTYKGIRHGRLNRVLELASVLYQPHTEPNVRTARKQKSAAMASTPALKKSYKKGGVQKVRLTLGIRPLRKSWRWLSP
jgi:hypothetical protein